MPLCSVADVKTAARVDADLTEWDAEIPHLIAAATEQIEHECNLPSGWFDQSPAPYGYWRARETCITIAAKLLDDREFDTRPILNGPRLDGVREYGDMPALPGSTTPLGALLIAGGYLTLPAGSLAITA